MEICGNSGLPIFMVRHLHQNNGNIKRKIRAWSVQKCITLVGSDSVLTSVGTQNTRFMGGGIGPRMEIWGTSGLPILMVPRLHQNNGSKGSYGHGEFKNVLPLSAQILYLPVRGRKLPRFMGDSIGPRMEICETSGLPIHMVPRLHQSNGNMKRSYGHVEFNKIVTLVGANTVLTTAGPQSTPFYGG